MSKQAEEFLTKSGFDPRTFIKSIPKREAGTAILIKDLLKIYAESLTNSQWISVEERLPKENVPVLVYDVFEEIQTACVWDDDFWIGDEQSRIDVTHWQPLPKPPKK